MKMRNGFVTNSSSINFIVVNITKEDLSLRDFFLENPGLAKSYMKQQIEDGWYGSEEQMSDVIDEWLENKQIGPFGILHYELSEAYDTTDIVLKMMEPGSGKSKRFIWKREYG